MNPTLKWHYLLFIRSCVLSDLTPLQEEFLSWTPEEQRNFDNALLSMSIDAFRQHSVFLYYLWSGLSARETAIALNLGEHGKVAVFMTVPRAIRRMSLILGGDWWLPSAYNKRHDSHSARLRQTPNAANGRQ